MWSSNNIEIKNDAYYGGIVSNGSGIICSSDVRARYTFHQADY
jgi:hypothetical protein